MGGKLHFMLLDRREGHLHRTGAGGGAAKKCVNNVKYNLRTTVNRVRGLTIGLSSQGHGCHVLVVRVSLFGTRGRWGC